MDISHLSCVSLSYVKKMKDSPQTEEIGLEIITTAKISNKFSRQSPYISNMFARESPNFQPGFHVSNQSPRHSKKGRKAAVSGDPNILSLISSVSGSMSPCYDVT